MFAETCVFGKQSAKPFHCGPLFTIASKLWALLLANLRSHFAEFLGNSSLAHLGILSLPTCVGFGTGRICIARSFSWKLASHASLLDRSFTYLLRLHLAVTGFAWSPVTSLRPQSIKRVMLAFSVPPSLHIRVQEYLPVFHPLRLRSRLTLIRLALIRKPWSCGVRVSRPHYRYLCRQSLFLASIRPSGLNIRTGTLSYRSML